MFAAQHDASTFFRGSNLVLRFLTHPRLTVKYSSLPKKDYSSWFFGTDEFTLIITYQEHEVTSMIMDQEVFFPSEIGCRLITVFFVFSRFIFTVKPLSFC